MLVLVVSVLMDVVVCGWLLLLLLISMAAVAVV